MFEVLVGKDFQKESLKAVFSAYDKAFAHCSENFDAATFHDILPHYRRAKIEEALREVALRAEDHTVKAPRNKARNCSHNLLFVNERVALTQSKVDRREQLPREAIFRETYASNPQMLLDFMTDGERDCCSDGSEENKVLYGILVHSPSEAPALPCFVDIVFPDQDCEYIIDRIRLMEKFPDVVEQFAPAEEVIVPEIDQQLQLKRSSTA